MEPTINRWEVIASDNRVKNETTKTEIRTVEKEFHVSFDDFVENLEGRRWVAINIIL